MRADAPLPCKLQMTIEALGIRRRILAATSSLPPQGILAKKREAEGVGRFLSVEVWTESAR